MPTKKSVKKTLSENTLYEISLLRITLFKHFLLFGQDFFQVFLKFGGDHGHTL